MTIRPHAPFSQTGRRRILVTTVAGALWAIAAVIVVVTACMPVQPPTATPAPTATSPAPQGDAAEGFPLAAVTGESVYAGARCAPGAPVREYRVAAVNVEITLNRFLDYDPQGRMYVLEEDLPFVRREEAQNKAARSSGAEPGVSIGLQGDAIQPLILRVNQGECLRVALRNAMDTGEAATFHLHGSGLLLAKSGAPATGTNADAIARRGQSVAYKWMVAPETPEGTLYVHSHGDERAQTGHGLFGAVIVEPKGSRHLDPLSGKDLRSGWAAVIQDPEGSDFREFALVYHEVGDERYQHLDAQGKPVPQVDPFTTAYRPGDRAMNYRSEPFMNRLALQEKNGGKPDISLAYSSYSFGDPTTPLARSYLGDPVKERVVHGGSEVMHVHHVHGGAVRWSRQPGVQPAAFDTGLTKRPQLLPNASERTDSQTIGPSETYDVVEECGSGGCQQAAGDFLFHCHISHHYLAGMWGVWRVYNTLQDGTVSQDAMPPLQQLPDRVGGVQPAVTSDRLAGTTVDWKGKKTAIAPDGLAAWVERQLPPAGVPQGYDASVLDWTKQGDLYLNEPQAAKPWPGYTPSNPGKRTPILFDPLTGKLAYPFLQPHLAKRPPFAPDHSPAPFLDPSGGTDPPTPGADGPWSLCPDGSKVQSFTIHAIQLPIQLDRKGALVDPVGQIYVLKEDEAAVRADNALRRPLTIRANAGQDCVDILFKNEIPDSPQNHNFSKVNVHVHFVQFDVQGSDGVTTGFNYEQSVRPFASEGEAVQAAAVAGDTSIQVANAARFHPGVLVGIGMDEERTFEARHVKAVQGDTLLLAEPLRFPHAPGEIVSTEFARYRWFPDVQFGTAYFHDHVDSLTSWKHGLFGALIAEPPDSRYVDPRTGKDVRSGTLVDVHTESKASADVQGSFRELVLFVQDDNPVAHVGRSSGGSYNLRAEPLDAVGADIFAAPWDRARGDPATPLVRAFLGDPVVIRGLVSGTNEVHSVHVDGHWFRVEPHSTTSPPVSTVAIGISERYDMFIPRAGGPQNMPGDYFYYSGRLFKLREGSWGILRVLSGGEDGALRPLPGREAVPRPAASVCPADAPRKTFDVSAVSVPLPMLSGLPGKVYVLDALKADVASGKTPPSPLVLHVNVHDCVQVALTNATDGPVSFHVDMLAYDPKEDAPTAPGARRTYTFFASPEVGETAAMVRDRADVLNNPRLGLYGAVIVGPRGAAYTSPVNGKDLSGSSGWRVDVKTSDGGTYRDITLFLQDEDEIIGTAQMPYTSAVKGVVGINYAAAPLALRLQANPDAALAFSSAVHGDPATPVLAAFAGDRVRLHLLVPTSEQSHVFTIDGHRWFEEPGLRGSTLKSAVALTGLQSLTLDFIAGGPVRLHGDYLYGDQRGPYREAGLWGVFHVYQPGKRVSGLLPLGR